MAFSNHSTAQSLEEAPFQCSAPKCHPDPDLLCKCKWMLSEERTSQRCELRGAEFWERVKVAPTAKASCESILIG